MRSHQAPTHSRSRLFLATTLVVLLVVQIAPAIAAPPGSSADRFVDDDRHVHEGAINALAKAGIVMGCNPPANDRFCPDRVITRGETATIIAGALELKPASTAVFADVGRSVHRRDIQALGDAGIAKGCNPPANNRFCPDGVLDRGQMAAFLARALDLPDGERTFRDTGSSVFRNDIARLAGAGITTGCNPPANDRYCPDRPMTRGEMASMVARAIGLDPIEIDHPEPPSTTTTTAPSGGGGSTTTTTPGNSGPGTTTTTIAVSKPSGPYPGAPANGRVYWGASIEGGADPVKHENPANHPMVLRRTFFQWSQRTGFMIRTIQDDIAAGRLSWVSVKTPSWADMAAGKHDAEIDQMLRALKDLRVDVWLTVHHEPEGGGGVNSPDDPAGPAGHLAMNKRVRQRMNALNVTNVALAPILMTWTWDTRSGRNPNEWWDSNVYDFIGVDHYQREEASLLTSTWYNVRSWAAQRGVDVAVGEWGVRGTDAAAGQRVREWYNHAAGSHADGRGARVVALAAYDNESTGGWELKGEQLKVFRELFRDSRTADPH